MSASPRVEDLLLNKPLKVWHAIGPMNRGGAEVMIMELLRHKAPDTQVNFLIHQHQDHVTGSSDFDAEIIERGGQLLPITTPTQSGIYAYFKNFRALIKANGKPHVIHSHLNARSGLVALAAKRNGIHRIIVHSHAELTFRGSLSYRIAANIELHLSKIVFAAIATDYWGCSREALKSLFFDWPSRKQPRVVINNAIDLQRYTSIDTSAISKARADLSGGQNGLLIGTVGRIVRHKNAAFLVDILDALRRRGITAQAAIIGREDDTAYCAEIRNRAAEMGLSDSLHFIGSRTDIPAIMAALDVFVSPALKEGFGLVALEAQAAGTPSVLSQGFPKLVDMHLGLTQMPVGFDPNDWANAILQAATCQRADPSHIGQVIADRGFSATENTRRIELAWRDPSFLPSEDK